jgi:hypothetical protein
LKARADHEAGRLPLPDLRRFEDEHVRKAVAMQEEIGLQSITDGEFRRGVFYADFICRGLGGASIYYEAERMFFVDDEGKHIPVPLLKIHDRLKWRGPVHVDEFAGTLTRIEPSRSHCRRRRSHARRTAHSTRAYPDPIGCARIVEAYRAARARRRGGLPQSSSTRCLCALLRSEPPR